MPLRVKCSGCGKVIKAGDDWAGKKAKCPNCATVLQFPAPLALALPAAPPDAWLSGSVTPLPQIASADTTIQKQPKDVEEGALNGDSRPIIRTTDKRIIPAFLLAVFFGGLGAHRFYAGRILSANVLLIMTLLGVGLVMYNGFIGLMKQSQRSQELAQIEKKLATIDGPLEAAFQDLSREGVARLDVLLSQRNQLVERSAQLQVESDIPDSSDVRILIGYLLLILVAVWTFFDVIQLMSGIFVDGNRVAIKEWTK